MASFGELRPVLSEMARSLRLIAKSQCGAENPAITSAGVADVPAGFKSVSITATALPVTMLLSDGSSYAFSTVGETITQSAADGGSLPAYDLSGAGTWKWLGIK
jgi:hypothetical protein